MGLSEIYKNTESTSSTTTGIVCNFQLSISNPPRLRRSQLVKSSK